MAQKRSAKKNYPDLHGIVLLNNPKGISSNLALQEIRHLFKAKKAGHTGNLDPMATGLLPCCFGDATKVAHLLINSDKTYVARCVLGSQTDTGDATGEVVETADITQLTDEQVLSACDALTGDIEQVPPMYSALHHNGRRLYELAREIIEKTNSKSKIIIKGAEIAQPQIVKTDISEIKKIGYEPKILLEKGINNCIDFYKDRLKK